MSNSDPIIGLDFDEIINVSTFAELDKYQVDLRKRHGVAAKQWLVKPLNSAFHFDRKKCFIGWVLHKKDGSKIWMRMSLYDMLMDHYARLAHAQNREE